MPSRLAQTDMQSPETSDPDPSGEAVFQFGGFELDVGRRTLTFEGEAQTIGSRAFDVLVALARRGGDFVSNRELVTTVWDRTALAEAAVRVQIRATRQALRADPDVRIINATSRGYRLWPTPQPKGAAAPPPAAEPASFQAAGLGELLVLRDASGAEIQFQPLYAGAPSHEILGLRAGEWPEHLSPAAVPFGARLMLVLGIARDADPRGASARAEPPGGFEAASAA
ncbi:winged helix-turn-helix domain-containing protein [Caulobacter sp. KR2-114]|uniref:winged helix-turn-helix domain-containing protein n=1 Tax=Caulobacter sp. KR2-114 TaxID=3400912 RepID=UPI003C11FED2